MDLKSVSIVWLFKFHRNLSKLVWEENCLSFKNPRADLNGTEKMEKAEILELTVNYIKAIKGHTNPGESN